MKKEVTLLQFGQPNTKHFLLYSIDIGGGNRWEADYVSALVCPIEYELVVRQDGNDVKVIQRKRDSIQQLEATIAKLSEALEFYADYRNYAQFYVASKGFSVSETLIDSGRKAREALGD